MTTAARAGTGTSTSPVTTPAARTPRRIHRGVLFGLLGLVFVAGAVVPAALLLVPEQEIVLAAPALTVVEHALWPVPPLDEEEAGPLTLGGVVLLDASSSAEPGEMALFPVSIVVHDEAGRPVASYEDVVVMRPGSTRYAIGFGLGETVLDVELPELTDWSVEVTAVDGSSMPWSGPTSIELTDVGPRDGRKIEVDVVSNGFTAARGDELANEAFRTLVARDQDGSIVAAGPAIFTGLDPRGGPSTGKGFLVWAIIGAYDVLERFELY